MTLLSDDEKNANFKQQTVEESPVPEATPSHCDKLVDPTDQEKALCAWNDDYDGLKRNATDAEWMFGLDVNTTTNADDLVRRRSRRVGDGIE